MYRVHDTIYSVDQFNPSPKGNARFSPILDSSGKVIAFLPVGVCSFKPRWEHHFSAFESLIGMRHFDEFFAFETNLI